MCTSSRKCWRCSRETLGYSLSQLYHCDGCGSIQRPIQCLTYFDLLGAPERFDLDVRALSASHRRLQFLLHPDKFAQRPPQEQRFAAEHSSFLNKGPSDERSVPHCTSIFKCAVTTITYSYLLTFSFYSIQRSLSACQSRRVPSRPEDASSSSNAELRLGARLTAGSAPA